MNPVFEVSGAIINGQVHAVEVYGDFPSVAEAEAFAKRLPKSWRVRGGGCSYVTDEGQMAIKGIVIFRADLLADGVNKGKNETGIGRARKFLAAIEWKTVSRYTNAATDEQIREALGI